MTGFSLEWHGAEAILAIRRAAREAETREAEALRDDTASRSAVGPSTDPTSGMLKASWTVGEADGHAVMFSDDPNAVYQEFGTSKMPAHPSLGPAEHVAEARWPVRLSEHLSVAVREFGGL